MITKFVTFHPNGYPHRTGGREVSTLAAREREVLYLLSKGYLYKEIGEQLDISTHTLNSHIRRIHEKLHVQSRSQAVAKYRGLG